MEGGGGGGIILKRAYERENTNVIFIGATTIEGAVVVSRSLGTGNGCRPQNESEKKRESIRKNGTHTPPMVNGPDTKRLKTFLIYADSRKPS